MAAGDRSKAIKERVRFVTGVDDVKMSDALIYSIMSDRARVMAERTLCIETSGSVAFVSGTGSTPANYYRMKQFVLPTTTRIQPNEIDVNEMDYIKRQLISPALNIVQWYSIFGGTITLFPIPTDQSYTLQYYALPSTTPSDSVDPETPARMDEVLKYGIGAEIMLYEKNFDAHTRFTALYQAEIDRELLSHRKTKTVSNVITYRDF